MTQKKRSKKKTAKKAGKVQSNKGFRPPKGYETMDLNDSEMATTHDFEAEPILQGKPIELKEIPKGGKIKNDTRVLVVETKAGLRSVWESARLRPLFDRISEIDDINEVYIKFEGYVKLKGRRQEMKEFKVAVK